MPLLDHDFCPQHSFQGDIWMLRSTLSWHHCLPHAQVVISRDVRKKTRLFFALSLISTTSACSLSRRRTLYYFSNLIGPCVLIARSPKRFFKDFRSIYSIYIWMHVISAWLFSVSISRLTLGKRCSCNNFRPKEDFVTSGDRILSYFVIFLLQVTLEITVLMSLTFFMNMVSSNKNQKVKMRPWL